MAATNVVWIGIDVGKASRHAAAVDADGQVLWSMKVPNDQHRAEELLSRALTMASQADVELRWAIDLTSATAALLTTVLLAGGQHVLYVPGRAVNSMAAAFRGEGKTDAKDARVIADTARMCHRELTHLKAPDELVVELTRLTAHRTDLMADWVRGVNRLRELLTSIFPALERSFDFSTRSALILISGFCTPSELRAAGTEGLTAYLAENGAWRKSIDSMVRKALDAADQQNLALPGEATTAMLAKRLARRLLDLDREIKDITKMITARFRAHHQGAILESLLGMGPILGAEFLVATGGDAQGAFGTTGRRASYAGLVPVPQDSGRVSGNLRRPKRYNRTLRRVFYMAAMTSLKADGPSRAFYDKKRNENKIHTQAVLALARRLVDVVWALLRDQRLFTPVPPEQLATAA
ncbi:IS110 family transposase [Spirillospora sp. CA-108201]